MKISIFVLFLLLTGTAMAQSVLNSTGISSQPMILDMPSHVQHASQTPLAEPQNILHTASNISARGERPTWEFMPQVQAIPLGDLARIFRQQHASARKAQKVWEQ